MPAGVAIRVHELGKRYLLGEDATFHNTLRGAVGARLSGSRPVSRSELWALDNVSFEVPVGEALAIVGRNGAGKSTLLKVLARITPPTCGRVEVRGRIGALLEVGTAFHPELTGKENIEIGGALLGMTRREIREKTEAIVDFAGLERAIDTPVKRYSSGMYLRLGFAVAAHFEPEILVVDEILAVGDAEFQKRCLGRLSEVGESGRTVVFVSHDLGAVTTLCSRAIWLDAGRIVQDGPSVDVVRAYLAAVSSGPGALTSAIAGEEGFELSELSLLDAAGTPAQQLERGSAFTIELVVTSDRIHRGADLGLRIIDSRGLTVADECVDDDAALHGVLEAAGTQRLRLNVPAVLSPGVYSVAVWIGTLQGSDYLNDEVLQFEVIPAPGDRADAVNRSRVTSPAVSWERV